jgi:hypothetical protein
MKFNLLNLCARIASWNDGILAQNRSVIYVEGITSKSYRRLEILKELVGSLGRLMMVKVTTNNLSSLLLRLPTNSWW